MWSASDQERTYALRVFTENGIAFVGHVLEVDFIHLQNGNVEF